MWNLLKTSSVLTKNLKLCFDYIGHVSTVFFHPSISSNDPITINLFSLSTYFLFLLHIFPLWLLTYFFIPTLSTHQHCISTVIYMTNVILPRKSFLNFLIKYLNYNIINIKDILLIYQFFIKSSLKNQQIKLKYLIEKLKMFTIGFI